MPYIKMVFIIYILYTGKRNIYVYLNIIPKTKRSIFAYISTTAPHANDRIYVDLPYEKEYVWIHTHRDENGSDTDGYH
jgi:hypothetical protein